MSWKKYGGTNNLESLNNIVVNSIVTDLLSVKKYYVGDWDICGALLVKDDSTLKRNAFVHGNLDVSGSYTHIRGNARISGNTEISGNLVVYDNAYLKKYLYLDPSGNTFVHGTNHAFGFNKYNPTATIDISSDQIFTVKMQTSRDTNRNIYAQNAGQQGIMLGVDPIKSYINMFVDSSMNVGDGTINAKLEYTKGGDFLIDVSNIMRVRPRMIFSRDITKNMNSDEEHVVIYDSSELRGVSYPYISDIYNDGNFKSGVALTAISKDNSSNIFMKMTSEEGKGAVIGAGPFEGGMMASIALIDSSASNFSKHIYPAINVFSGNLISNLKTSIGINKYHVSKMDLSANRYSLDVNGPMKLIHQEMLMTLDVSMQVLATSVAPSKKVIYAIGSPFTSSAPFKQYFLKSVNSGYSWTRTYIPLGVIESGATFFRTIFAYSDSIAVIAGEGGLIYYTSDGGNTWNRINFTIIGAVDFIINSFILINNAQNAILGLNNGYFLDVPNIINLNINYDAYKKDSSLNSINGVDGSGNIAFFAGSTGIQGYQISTKTLSSRISSDLFFNDISLYYDGVTYHVAAVGDGRISYAHTNTHENNGNWNSIVNTPYNLKKVKVFDSSFAIAIGDDGLLMYSNNGFSIWNVITKKELDAMGNGSNFDSLNFTSIVSTNVNDFIISGYSQPFNGGTQQGRTKMIHFHAPYFFNRDNNFVLEASGSILLSGDMNVNHDGKLRTNFIDGVSSSNTNTLQIGNLYASKILIGSTDTTTDIRIGKRDGSLSESRGTQSEIHIGDSNSNVHIYGNLFVPGSVISENVSNLEVKNKAIKLNDEALTSSVGSGIYIHDAYSGSIPGIGFDYNGADAAGQILVNSSRMGFKFKAPASSKYINFDLDNFLVNFDNGSDKGIVTIGYDSVNNFTVKQRDVQIMDIINLDVSINRRVFRNAALTYNVNNPNTQVIDDKLTMTGLMINKMQNQMISNTQMDISGNTIITKLGLGTSSVNNSYVLDISGNTWTNGSIIQW
jgi:hypothetical protein